MHHGRATWTFIQIFMRLQLFAVLSLVTGCGAERAPSGALALSDVAREWSGSSLPPQCTPDVQQKRDGVPRTLRMETCAWPVQSRGRGEMRLTGVKTPIGALGLLTRQEDVPDSAAAFRLRDSLSTALRAQGFREYQCYSDDRQWRSSRGAVHFSVGAVLPTGFLRIGIFAATDSQSIPSIACPDSSAQLLR